MRGLIWAAIAIAGFVVVAALMLTGHSTEFDRHILLSLRTGDTHDPVGPEWVEQVFVAITWLGNWYSVLAVAALVVGYLLATGRRATAALVGLTALGEALLNEVLKAIFERPRPDLVAHGVEVTTTSFPSGHAMAAAALYLTLGALLVRTQKQRAVKAAIMSAAVLMALAIGISRVYLGVHWPSDVIAGWLAGAGWALVCFEIARWLQRRGQIERARN